MKNRFLFFLIIVIFVCLFLIVKNFFVFRVSGNSMYPTFNDGDYILVMKSKNFKVGDIIVFFSIKKGSSEKLVKRVMAKEGMALEYVKDGKYIRISSGKGFKEFKDSYIIPNDFLFVMGDNLQTSYDSREGWLVNRNLVIGKVICRFFPPKLFFVNFLKK